MALLRFARGLLSLIWRTFFRAGYDLQERYGVSSWACVTGASDGVGAAMAKEVARRGFNVILVARNRSKLETIRDQILIECPKTQVDIVMFDMASGFGDAPNTLKMIKKKNVKKSTSVMCLCSHILLASQMLGVTLSFPQH